MRHFWRLLAAGLMLAAPVRAAVWLEPATVKILKDAQPSGEASALSIEAVRNEYVAFQVALTGGVEGMAEVEITLSDLTGVDGALLSATNATLYLEYYHFIEKPSPCDIFFSTECELYPPFERNPGFYPDALIPFYDPYQETRPAVAVPFAVPSGDVQAVFVDLWVPPDAAPGDYVGVVTVTAGGGVLKELKLTLHVFDVTLPNTRNVATAFGFGADHIKNYHGGPNGPDPDLFQELVRNYEWEVHRHRMDFTTHYPGLTFEFDPNDQLKPVDFSAYDSYIGPRIDGSYYPDGAGINRYNLGILRPGHGTMGLSEAQFQQVGAAVFAHLKEKGYLDHVYLYSTDEPWMIEHWQSGSFEKIKATMDLLDGVTDLHRGHVLVTGPWQEIIGDLVDIWCPVTPMYGDVYWPEGSWPGAGKYQELQAAGRELWFYVCNANFPGLMGYDIDSPLGHEPRLLKWGAWAEGATGFLYWRLTYWFNNDPWNALANWDGFGEQFSRNGDGILIYPGDHDGKAGGTGSPANVAIAGPVVSLRMKQIRDGLEDWELFILADELGATQYARDQVATVYRAFGEPLNGDFDINDPPWALDSRPMLDARANVARKLQFLLHPKSYPDPDAPELVEEGAVVDRAEASPDALVASDLSWGETVNPGQGGDPVANSSRQGSGCGLAEPTRATPPILALLLLLLVIHSLSVVRRAHHER
jgi:hypothetical protein